MSGFPDAPSWWGAPGRAGYAPDLAWGTDYPWVFAGHVRGAWALRDAWLPPTGPFPGVSGSRVPLGWLDSLAIEPGTVGAWEGFDATLAQARPVRDPPRRRPDGRTRAVTDLVLSSGTSAYDANALAIARGDSASGLRVGALSWNRGGLGALGAMGRHQVEASGRWTRGRHGIEGTLGQAGSAASLVAGVEQSGSGAGGSLRYGLDLERYDLRFELARGYDHHESFGSLLAYSRRDAHQRTASGEILARSGAWGARVEVREALIVRVSEGLGEDERRATSLWVAARMDRRRGPAGLHAALGAGRHDAVKRTEVAPSLAFDFGEGSVTGRAYAGRVVAPVWADLGPGTAPFLQSTWLGGFKLGWRGSQANGEAGWVMGRTRDRAVVTRWPLEELWLREGFRPDPDSYDFALATSAGQWSWRSWRARGEAYWLLRDAGTAQAQVDRRRGGRASLETGFRAFAGDLGVRVRGELELVSGRALATGTPGWVAGHATTGVGVGLTLADAVVTFGLRNLEDRRRPLPWVDPSTGEEALGEGMEFRFGLTWRLYN